MPKRQRSVITISVPPDMAKEYREIAKERGESSSQFFREMFSFYKNQKLKDELSALQQYGIAKVMEAKLTEEDIERLVFSDR